MLCKYFTQASMALLCVVTMLCLGCADLFVGNVVTVPTASSEQDKHAKMFESVNGMSVIFIYRTGGENDASMTDYFIDRKHIAGTISFTFVRVVLPPGTHDILCRTEADYKLNIQTSAGEVYFIEQRFLPGWRKERPWLTLENDKHGKKNVLKCKLVELEAAKISPQDESTNTGQEGNK